MRLIHLAAYGGTYPGSFIPMVRGVLNAGQQRGWRAEAVFSETASDRPWLSQLADSGISCHFAADSHRRRAQLVKDIVAVDEPLILHTHFASFDVPAVAAALRRGNAVVYWHKHGGLCHDAKARIRNTLKAGVLGRHVEEILCVAPNVVRDAQRCLAPRKRLVLLPNAIDLSMFQPADAGRRSRAREQLGLSLESRVILHFGWDWHRKGGDVLLEAISALARRGEATNLVVLTVADDQTARAAAAAARVSKHVRALPPTDDVQSLYAASDLFASPSRSEGHPFAVVEALASGLPVIASPIPGHEMVAQSAKACRITRLDHALWADAIAATLREPSAEREARLTEDRGRLVDTMDIHAWSERMLARYERALALRSLI